MGAAGKRGFWVALLAAVAFAVAAWAVFRLGGQEQEEDRRASSPAQASESERAAAPANAAVAPVSAGGLARRSKTSAKRKEAAKRRTAEAAAEAAAAKRAQLSPAEQQLVDKIEDAVDAESLSALLALAPKAEAAKPAVRVSYVEALGWFGYRALPEMTPFLADSDQEVRDTAVSEWTQALDEIEDDARRLAIAERAFMVVSDEDVLESISGAYLGIDDESLAVASLAKIIAADCPAEAREKAKETYNFVTGDEWTGAAAAEEWISQYKRENEEDQEHNDIYDNQDEESEDQDE